MKISKLILILCFCFSFGLLYSQDTTSAEIQGSKDFTNYIVKYIIYPGYAVENGIKGQVDFKFKVKIDGCIDKDSIIILTSPDKSLSDEVIRTLRTIPCKWKPAISNNKPVDSWIKSYVNFNLKR